MWFIEKKGKSRIQEISTAKYTGGLVVYRPGEVGSKDVFGMAAEMLKFGGIVSGQEEDKFV